MRVEGNRVGPCQPRKQWGYLAILFRPQDKGEVGQHPAIEQQASRLTRKRLVQIAAEGVVGWLEWARPRGDVSREAQGTRSHRFDVALSRLTLDWGLLQGILDLFARTLCPHRAMDRGVRFDFKRTNLQQGAGSEQRAEGLAAERSGTVLGRTDAEGLRGGRRTEEDIGPPRNR
jgi:hypothetical protein